MQSVYRWGIARLEAALRRRAAPAGVSDNGTKILWLIVAIVLGLAVLYGVHNQIVPWIQNFIGQLTGINTSTT